MALPFFGIGRASAGFLTRYERELREPLVWRQGSQVPMRWLRGNFYAEYIMRNAGLDEAQAGIKIAGEISITSDIQMTPPLW